MPQSLSFNWRSLLLPLCAVLGYWALLIYQLGAQWSVYDQYGYGWAVPFLCAYLVWQQLSKRGEETSNLQHRTSNIEAGKRSTSDSPVASGYSPDASSLKSHPRPSASIRGSLVVGLLVLLAFLYAPTRLLHEANPIWRLTSWLWTLEVIAITLLLFSTLNLQLSTRLAFPLLFFLVAVPWPSAAENFLVQTLTGANMAVTIELLNTFGIPALQHGNIIEITTGVVGVNEACSGIRSFQATLMLSLFFGELYSLTIGRRIWLCLLGFASSFGFNVARTFILTYVASKQGIVAIDKWHDPAGITILVWCFVAIWFASLVMKPDGKGSKGVSPVASDVPSDESSPPGHVPSPAGAGQGRQRPGEETSPETSNIEQAGRAGIPAGKGQTGERAGTPSTFNPAKRCGLIKASRPQPSTMRFASVGLIAWLVLVETGVQFWYRSHEQAGRRDADWSLRVDELNSSYTKVETPPEVLSQFNADQNTELRWQDEGKQWQLYYFRWHPAQSLKRRVSVQLAKTHGPEKCLPAAGMTMQSYLGIKKVQIPGLTLAVQHYAFGDQGRLVHVFYAIYEDPSGTEELANRRRDFGSRVAAALAGSRNYGQRFLELAVWGMANEEQATAALQRQLEQLIRIEP